MGEEALAQEELLIEKVETENGLIAIDPWGQETRLALRKYDVDVYIEDGIARTTIDQTFFNHYPSNTEGTFYFPLPPDASVSRLAMYVNGKLNEGGMVERGRGQEIYMRILHQRRDPALLEMMEGNVFKMRIFPLEGRQEKRIFLSYTQRLEELYSTMRYWFPMDHTHSVANHLSIRVRVKGGADAYDPQSSTHKLAAQIDGDDLVLTYNAEKTKPDQDFLLHLIPSKQLDAARIATCEKDGLKYVFGRFTPKIPGKVVVKPRQWIVLNDISASRSNVESRAQRYVFKRLLQEADDDDSVFLLDLNTRAHLVSKGFSKVRSEVAKKLLDHRAQAHLGGIVLAIGCVDTPTQSIVASERPLVRGEHRVTLIKVNRAVGQAEYVVVIRHLIVNETEGLAPVVGLFSAGIGDLIKSAPRLVFVNQVFDISADLIILLDTGDRHIDTSAGVTAQ